MCPLLFGTKNSDVKEIILVVSSKPVEYFSMKYKTK